MLHAPAREAQSEGSRKRNNAAAVRQHIATADFMPRVPGNQARLRSLASGAAAQRPSRVPMFQRKCACGGTCASCKEEGPKLRTKLAINEPGDVFEQEADRVAAQVMRMPVPSPQAKPTDGPGAESRTSDAGVPDVSPVVGDVLRSPGQPLDRETRAFMEPRFGRSFADVRVHDGPHADRAAGSVQARAFTLGRDVVFAAGEHDPRSEDGKRLLAHELTHVVQQCGADATLQRQHVADTGFRYTPPATVKRSIVEIQGIVGTTPDGDYGENTRIAVEKYQTKLKDAGFYSDTADGKWGNNTEAAHVAFATAPNVQRRGYNCAGFAFKDFTWHDLAPTKAIYATMTKLADCSKPCSPFYHKFWMWEVDVRIRNTATGALTGVSRDFHTVGGQTDKDGNGPNQVMSKNGQRPVLGPKPPLDWEPVSGPALDQITGLPVPDHEWVISGTQQDCFCSEKLP
jgi:hypothetical protein